MNPAAGCLIQPVLPAPPDNQMIYVLLACVIAFMVFRALSSKPDVSREEAFELLEGGARLLDVRTAAEYRAGHIKGSMNLPLDTLPESLKRQNLPPATPLVLYCSSGVRSRQGKRLLLRSGYTRVFNGGSLKRLKNANGAQ